MPPSSHDLAAAIALIASSALWATLHVLLIVRLRPWWRAPAALLVVPLAPYWGVKSGLRMRSALWCIALVFAVVARLTLSK